MFRKHSFISSFFLSILVLAPGAVAGTPQQSKDSETTAQATDAYQAKDWVHAAELYTKVTAEHPNEPRGWYRLGVSLHATHQEQLAITAFEKASSLGAPQGNAEYGIAECYAALKNTGKAFEYLQKAVDAGYAQPERLEGDAELAALRSDDRWGKISQVAKRNQKPCAYTPEYRQFDFWLGQWNVVTSDGKQPAGNSKIELILGDCVIQENWTSLSSTYEGKSYNTYNPNLKRWEQFWNDNSAGMIHFYGGLKDGVMDYWTDNLPQPDGTMLKRHLQFIQVGPDTVRQFSQGSNDDGKTWSVEYDFTYNRAK